MMRCAAAAIGTGSQREGHIGPRDTPEAPAILLCRIPRSGSRKGSSGSGYIKKYYNPFDLPTNSKDSIVDMLRIFLPAGSNEARMTDQIDTHINKIVELGFARRLRTDSSSIEVRRILKAFIDTQWLDQFDSRLKTYASATGAGCNGSGARAPRNEEGKDASPDECGTVDFRFNESGSLQIFSPPVPARSTPLQSGGQTAYSHRNFPADRRKIFTAALSIAIAGRTIYFGRISQKREASCPQIASTASRFFATSARGTAGSRAQARDRAESLLAGQRLSG